MAYIIAITIFMLAGGVFRTIAKTVGALQGSSEPVEPAVDVGVNRAA